MKLTPLRQRKDELGSIRDDFDRLVSGLFEAPMEEHLPPALRAGNVPPVNVSESDKAWLVSVELPGMEEKDIHVDLRGNLLTISGERAWSEEKKDKQVHRVESQFGSFRRVLALPTNLRLDPNAISARYAKGMLEVTIPKVEPTPAARIQVKGGEAKGG